MKVPKLLQVGENDFAIVDADRFDELSRYNWRMGSMSYPVGAVNGVTIAMHRHITKAQPEQEVDHINHSGLDNRLSNLRICTRRQNTANTRKRVAKEDRSFTSRFKGVSFRSDRMRWAAYIGTGKNREALGCYSTEEAAARAYNEAATRIYGEFAKLNHVEEELS